MIRVTAIVEGYGDVEAVPVLLGRTGQLVGENVVARDPIRAGEWLSIKAKRSLPKFLELAYSRAEDMILVFLDLDDGCPVTEAEHALKEVFDWKNGRDISVSVVFATREYETFFLHCPEGLPNYSPEDVSHLPEGVRDAKGMVRKIIGRRYKETQDQLNFTRSMDLSLLLQRSRSFKKLYSDIKKNISSAV